MGWFCSAFYLLAPKRLPGFSFFQLSVEPNIFSLPFIYIFQFLFRLLFPFLFGLVFSLFYLDSYFPFFNSIAVFRSICYQNSVNCPLSLVATSWLQSEQKVCQFDKFLQFIFNCSLHARMTFSGNFVCPPWKFVAHNAVFLS